MKLVRWPLLAVGAWVGISGLSVLVFAKVAADLIERWSDVLALLDDDHPQVILIEHTEPAPVITPGVWHGSQN